MLRIAPPLTWAFSLLVENYKFDFRDYDERYSSVESSFVDKKNAAQKIKILIFCMK